MPSTHLQPDSLISLGCEVWVISGSFLRDGWKTLKFKGAANWLVYGEAFEEKLQQAASEIPALADFSVVPWDVLLIRPPLIKA